MQVIISVGGKFHAFTLARVLEKHGYLEKIFTSYPWFILKKSGIAQDRAECLILKEILERGLAKTPYLGRKIDGSYLASNLFDKLVAGRIKACDIFVGWSGFSLFTMRRLRRSSSARLILERCSSHIEFQRDILIEEAKITGFRLTLPGPDIIEKELKEYQEADFISIPSDFVKRTFIAKGIPEKKLIHIPYCVDTEIFRPVPKNDTIFRIIVVGICLRKGIQYLLKAMESVRLKNFEVWLIGRIDNDMKPLLKSFPGNWKCLGNIPNAELFKYYSQGSLFVLPSVEEGLSYAILEAMACQLPVICTLHTGGGGVVDNDKEGFVIPIRDEEKLREKILYCYENQKLCREMGENARRKIKNNFTPNHYGEKIIMTYLSLLNKTKITI